MSPLSPDMLTRFCRLPRNPAEVWQGGLVRLPFWIEKGPDGKPYRPWGALWASLQTGRANQMTEHEPGEHDFGLMLEALLEFGLKRELAGCRPGRIEVADEECAAYLRRALADAGLTVSVSKELPALKLVLADFGEYMNQGSTPPDALDVPGMTVEAMRAFASAAERFYLAAPWRFLTDEDLIRVEDPVVEPGLGHLTVLGSAGQVFGLGFYETPGEHAALLAAADPIAQIESRGHWSVFYGSIMDLPLGDADLWAEHCLPVAGDQAYPVAVWLGPGEGVRRPDLRILGNLEAVLLALAGTSEDEIDRGRWTRQVETPDGPKAVTLCIPALLEPLDAPPTGNRSGMPDPRIMERTLAEMERFMATSDFHDLDEANAALQSRFVGSMDAMPSTAATPLEKAQDLVYRAFDARGRRKIQLVRKALELSPDCADAYVALAEQATDGEAARDLYAQGVAAGERALGPAMFEQEVGHFWGLTSSRPYMRARFGLARCLEEQGRTGDAIGHYHELLRLNPDDNQGVRDVLLPVLLIAKRDAEAGALLSRYGEDSGALWQYAGALWAFRQEGDSPAARDRLRAALRANRHVAKYLTGKSKEPETLPESYAFGSTEEAMLCAHDLGPAWRATPSADRWLIASTPRPKAKRKPPPRRRR